MFDLGERELMGVSFAHALILDGNMKRSVWFSRNSMMMSVRTSLFARGDGVTCSETWS